MASITANTLSGRKNEIKMPLPNAKMETPMSLLGGIVFML